jgi:hypothetical protein
MWAMLALMAFGAFGGVLVHGNVLGSIRAAYPSDLGRRDALHRCGRMDAEFSRFSEHDRAVVLPGDAARLSASLVNPAGRVVK